VSSKSARTGLGLNGVAALDLCCHHSADVVAINPTVDAIAGHMNTAPVDEQLFPDLRNGPFSEQRSAATM
jgi:hypothetical protein